MASFSLVYFHQTVTGKGSAGGPRCGPSRTGGSSRRLANGPGSSAVGCAPPVVLSLLVAGPDPLSPCRHAPPMFMTGASSPKPFVLHQPVRARRRLPPPPRPPRQPRGRPAAGRVVGLASRHSAVGAPVGRCRVGQSRRVGIRAASPAERRAATGGHTWHGGGSAVSPCVRRRAPRGGTAAAAAVGHGAVRHGGGVGV